MRATAKDATGQGSVLLVTEQGYGLLGMARVKLIKILIEGEVGETRRIKAKEMNCEEPFCPTLRLTTACTRPAISRVFIFKGISGRVMPGVRRMKSM